MKVTPELLEDKVKKLIENQKSLEKEVLELKKKLASGQSRGQITKTGSFKGKKLWVHELPEADATLIRQKADSVRVQNPTDIHVITGSGLVLATADLKNSPDFHAGNFLKELLAHFGGRGGGQAHSAQGQIPGKHLNPEEIIAWASKH